MNTKTQLSRTLYGIQTRNSNETPHEIAALWQRFMADGLADEIPERADEQLIAAQFDYRGDHTQPYTLFLGCEVTETWQQSSTANDREATSP
ncbi:GyrI-like domain-containing protein [Stieleria sedimenti]|uniref:GyrI-like domain-containing protein n=1 Tax=Stieleria sedimenti TaxID=2976331 RepID=UPI00217FC51A|nr:GyrI-like domain-containing protein [Stieleria sedimenti]